MAIGSHVYTWEKENEDLSASGRLERVGRFESWKSHPSVENLWGKVERYREAAWGTSGGGLLARVQCRAFLVARSLPILPGRKVLELGAGSGFWTEHLAYALGGQNPITAAVFDGNLARKAFRRKVHNTKFIHVKNFQEAFSKEQFDYIVSTDVVTDDLCLATLAMVHRWLKSGGQFIFFGQNPSNPMSRLRRALSPFTRQERSKNHEQDIHLQKWKETAAQLGFDGVEMTRLEVICPLRSMVGQAAGLILERAPAVRCFSKAVSFRAAKPGAAREMRGPHVNLATHRRLFGSVSVVVPCHNEESNIPGLVATLLGMYSNYIHEIVIVDDNSTDQTARVAATVASTESRVKVVRRSPPGGVGRALRDGYAAAGGRYILSIDCDFANIAAEFKGLFDAVAEGCDGAIGSRFSCESALVHYPLPKILCNRGYHLILNLLLGKQVRDISNNLKLYRADILKDITIEEDGFAANVETGLKPLLMNYHIREVPTSWINRTADMGESSFSLLKVGPDYLGVLLRATWRYWRGWYRPDAALHAGPDCPRAD